MEKYFFLKGFCSPVSRSIHVQGQIDPTYTFLMKSHQLDQGLLSFKEPKICFLCCRKRETQPQPSLLIFLSSPILGCLVAKKIQLSYCFPNCFTWIFLRKNGLILYSFISQFLIYLGLGKNSISFCVDWRRGRDRVWCGLQVCFRKRWEPESGKY